jgi:SAM-dependent methyltransferase
MHKEVIQRQYDEVIAKHYDVDPQGVIQQTISTALDQLDHLDLLKAGLPALRVLDLGVGTGLFLERLMQATERDVVPAGLDISKQMVEIARERISEINTAVDDAANFESHFSGQMFDMICTHFVTGFVPMQILAPKIWEHLEPGGYWSFVGGTSRGYPALQRIAKSRLLQALFNRGGASAEDNLLTPEDEEEVNRRFEEAKFESEISETFEPELRFENFDGFMEFAYHGGWLTPFVEELGLQRAGWLTRRFLNTAVFPIRDHHSIVIAVARKRR